MRGQLEALSCHNQEHLNHGGMDGLDGSHSGDAFVYRIGVAAD